MKGQDQDMDSGDDGCRSECRRIEVMMLASLRRRTSHITVRQGDVQVCEADALVVDAAHAHAAHSP